MDQGANHLHFFANFGLEKMSPNDHTPLGGLLSMEEGFVVMSSSGSTSEGESSSIDAADDDDTINSIGSTSSSSDLVEDDDASSPPTNGPLYELSELMAQLPIKRGLSKFYQGKSQSYASLARVTSLEDLAKKGHFPKRPTMKSCKSYSGVEGKCFSPKATISKRASRGSFLSSSNLGRRSGSFVGSIGIPCPHRTT